MAQSFQLHAAMQENFSYSDGSDGERTCNIACAKREQSTGGTQLLKKVMGKRLQEQHQSYIPDPPDMGPGCLFVTLFIINKGVVNTAIQEIH